MKKLIAFILGLIAGVVGMLAVNKKSKSEELIDRERKEKEEKIGKIMDYLKDKEKISNSDIESLLGVSDASAERYLNELEKRGVIKQVGKEGRAVYYEKV